MHACSSRVATGRRPRPSPGPWDEIASIVGSAYEYLEARSGRQLQKGVLLYVVQVETIPKSYKMTATYRGAVPWEQVGFVLLQSGEKMDPHGDSMLTEVIFDTLPHELTHNLLRQVGTLQHDKSTSSGERRYQTRWFIDGACELLAKGFAKQHDRESWRHRVRDRNVGAGLSRPEVRGQIFDWAQSNENSITLKSDLYGAALLLVEVWTASQPLSEILERLEALEKPADGEVLTAWMVEAFGQGKDAILDQAQRLGEELAEEVADSAS